MATSTNPLGQLRSVGVALLIAAAGLIGGFALVLGTVLGIQLAGFTVGPLLSIVISLVLLQGVAFGSVAYGYLRFRGHGLDYAAFRMPSLRDLGFVVGGYVLAFALAIAGAIVVSQTGAETGQNQAAQLGLQNPEVLLLLIPASFIFIGPGEELLFRGVVQNRIRESFGPAPSVLIAGFIFAAIHFTALTGAAGARLVSIAILFFPSLVFGAVYELTDNLTVSALIHGAYDATIFGVLYLVIRYTSMQPSLI